MFDNSLFMSWAILTIIILHQQTTALTSTEQTITPSLTSQITGNPFKSKNGCLNMKIHRILVKPCYS